MLAPIKVLPVLGRQLRATTLLLDAAVQVGTDTATAIDQLQEIAGEPAATPEDRVDAVRASQEVLDELSKAIADPDAGQRPSPDRPGRATPTSGSSTSSTQTQATVDSATISLAGVGDLLQGPSTYLVLAANNAEMRSGSGMFLQVGTVTITDGAFELSDFVPAQELFLDQPGSDARPRDGRPLGIARTQPGVAQPEPVAPVRRVRPHGHRDVGRVGPGHGRRRHGDRRGRAAAPADADRTRRGRPRPPASTTFDADNVRNQLLRKQYEDFDDRGERRDLLGECRPVGVRRVQRTSVPAADLVGPDRPQRRRAAPAAVVRATPPSRRPGRRSASPACCPTTP